MTDELDRKISDGLHGAAAGWQPDPDGARTRVLGVRPRRRMPGWAVVAAASVAVVAVVAVPLTLTSGRAALHSQPGAPGVTTDSPNLVQPTLPPTFEPSSVATTPTPGALNNCSFTVAPDGSGSGRCTHPVISPTPSDPVVTATTQDVTCRARPCGPSAPTAPTTTVTNADSGSTVRLRAGDVLRVVLSGGWTAPATGDERVLQTMSRYRASDYSNSTGAYAARSGGQTDVSASSDAACFHAQPRCLMPSRQWTVHVIVS